jgi:predicted CoA-binding protein
MSKPTIAIVGASPDRRKFGNKAVRAYAQRGYEVYPIHPRAAVVEGHPAYRSVLDVPVSELDRVSLYVPPEAGMHVVEEVARKPVREVWLNPGAESPVLIAKARALGFSVVLGCSILDVGIDPHALGS